jgi:hypothetical protein
MVRLQATQYWPWFNQSSRIDSRYQQGNHIFQNKTFILNKNSMQCAREILPHVEDFCEGRSSTISHLRIDSLGLLFFFLLLWEVYPSLFNCQIFAKRNLWNLKTLHEETNAHTSTNPLEPTVRILHNDIVAAEVTNLNCPFRAQPCECCVFSYDIQNISAWVFLNSCKVTPCPHGQI